MVIFNSYVKLPEGNITGYSKPNVLLEESSFVGEFPPGHNCSFLLLTLPALVSENHPLTWFNIRSGVFLKLNPHRKTMISLLNRFIFTMISPAFEFSSELEIANPIKIS